MALPSWRIGLVASCGLFSKRTAPGTDLAAPIGFATARHHGQTNDLFCLGFRRPVIIGPMMVLRTKRHPAKNKASSFRPNDLALQRLSKRA
jgi:hypothetical protein